MSSHAQQAQTLVEALPYIQKFTGKTIVIKYGGNAMISDEPRKAVMSDIILLSPVGIRGGVGLTWFSPTTIKPPFQIIPTSGWAPPPRTTGPPPTPR